MFNISVLTWAEYGPGRRSRRWAGSGRPRALAPRCAAPSSTWRVRGHDPAARDADLDTLAAVLAKEPAAAAQARAELTSLRDRAAATLAGAVALAG